MDSDMTRTQPPRPQINPQQQQYRPTVPPQQQQPQVGQTNLVNPNLGPPIRQPLPAQGQNGQPPNLIRPPPPQLRRTDSRPVLQPPGQIQQQQLQRPQGPPQPQQPFNPNQVQRPQGPPGQQPLQQPPQQRPPVPNSGAPIVRGPPPPGQPLQPPQQLQNRPPFPQQLNPQQQPSRPVLRPQGLPVGGVPLQPGPPNINSQYRPQLPLGGGGSGGLVQRPPIRQPSAEFDPKLQTQNSFERQQQQSMSAELQKPISRPNSVLSNDDDDDVVIGRAVTPNSGASSGGVAQINRTPSDLQNQKYGQAQQQQQQQLQRNDSKLSMPSRPPSGGIGGGDQHSKSPSPENINKSSAISNQYTPTRPPSVTFREDLSAGSADKYKSLPSPMSGMTSLTARSPISLNSIISEGGQQQQQQQPAERISTPTSEKFRTTPMQQLQQERPVNFMNGNYGGIKSSMKYKGDNDSGVDETTQGNDRNEAGSLHSPLKSPSKIPGLSRPPSATPSTRSQEKARAASRTRTLKTPETPTEPQKKVPMNKVQVGNAPSPNLKQVRSKIGSLENATHKPGGGNVKIESKKLEFKVTPRIEAKNDKYTPKGGEKKIITTKLQWSAKSKIGSLDNANHKPGGGDKKIESIKTEFKDKAKPKVGSKDNVKYIPGGGDIKSSIEDEPKELPKSATTIQTQKVDIKAQSKIGSMDNVKHRPGGGDKKIFDDKDYLKNVDHPIPPPQQTSQHFNWTSSSLTSSISLPAECIVLSVTSATSPRRKLRRISSTGTPRGRAFHPRPFRLY